MINGLIYRLEWMTAIDDITVTVNIYDTSVQIEDDENPQVINLTPSGTPLYIRSLNNSSDKMSPVQGKQAEIQFLSSSNYDITTFSDGGDNRYYVEILGNHISTGDKTIFLGYLILTDCQQPFQPNPNTVRLIASDHLALLSEIPWSEDNGNITLGKMRIAEAVALCLKKTGLSLPLNVVSNLRHGSGSITDEVAFIAPSVFSILPNDFFYIGQRIRISNSSLNDGEYTVIATDLLGALFVEVDGTIVNEASTPGILIEDISSEENIWQTCFVESVTHEASAGERESCLTVIQKILNANGEQLCQWLGGWWVRRVDEYDGNDMYWTQFDENGDFTATPLVIPLDKSIGAEEDYRFALADQILSISRPIKEKKDTFNFRTPQEIPTNSKFERGAVIDESDPLIKTYELDSWRLFKGLPNAASADNSHFIRKEFNNNTYESSRYAVIGVGGTDAIYYIESDGFLVKAGDKFNFSVDFKWNGQVETSAGPFFANIAQIRLYADDGTHYTFDGGRDGQPTPEWKLNNSTWSSDNGYIYADFDGAEDDTEWRTASFYTGDSSLAIPKDGYLTFLLHSQTKPDEFEIHFSNLSFEYIPLINSTYQQYLGQSLKVSRDDDDYIAKISEETYYGDSPKPGLKGGTFLIGTGEELFAGDARFVAPDAIILENGDFRNSFTLGQTIIVSSSTSNNETFRILGLSYTIIGDETIITVQRGITTEASNPIVINKGVFTLTSRFYTAAPFALDPPTDSDGIKPFGRHQVESSWNQYRNAYRSISGTVLGLTINWPDLVHRYSLTDTNPNTNDKKFTLIELVQDWKSCIWTAKFTEVYDSVKGKVYDDDFEFKYIAGE
jgi:hypothetical protein